ncbi:hypothetical protein BLNAU_12316 [Blattamonas nauphoetae]|uniref:Uncharacterized protein n=1 Tax=Blattamonas nauphoetae TaxID=2049346 RepID=A0ABQ9XMN4_9EUKA|nr:hypothetical protein BLNAU_12316 [Blattamonas nauphoetae]
MSTPTICATKACMEKCYLCGGRATGPMAPRTCFKCCQKWKKTCLACNSERQGSKTGRFSGGREGQRVVLEADGREGKRTLKLSQDGETQPVIFTNIPVPFRFAVYIVQKNDAFEIESAEVVSSPQMVGGTIAVVMDE